MKLLQALGLDIRILIAQLINFAVLLFVLWRFGYKPVLKFLDDRKDKIEQGVVDAKKAGEKLSAISAKEEEVMKKAKKEALNILAEAKKQGEENRKKIVTKAREEVGQIINEEKRKIQVEKSDTLKEIKRDIGGLVTQAVSKILGEKMDSAKDRNMIEKTVKGLK